MSWHAYSFFNVWQDVLQTKLSKMTIPPEGASDGFANNFDQLKWRKTSFIWLFQNLSNLSETINCPLLHLPPSSFPPSSRKDTLQFTLSTDIMHIQPLFPKQTLVILRALPF